MNKAMAALVGRTVAGISISKGEGFLCFATDAGMVVWEADGDCCSESWFADIIGLKALLGSKVLTVQDLELPDYNVEDGRGRQEEDVVYGINVKSSGGDTDIIFRNSSNGYYGGELLLATEDDIYAGARPLTALTEDFRA